MKSRTTTRARVLIVLVIAVGCRNERSSDAGSDGSVDGGASVGAIALIGNDFGTGTDDLLIGYFGGFTASDVPPPACPVTDGGHCCLIPRGIGLPVTSPLLFPEDTQLVGVGPLAVTDTTSGMDLGTVAPAASPYGVMYVGAQLTAWADQDSLSVVAGGGVLPAFRRSVQSPPRWAGLDPAVAGAASGDRAVPIPVTADFTVTWSPQPNLDDAIIGVTGTEETTNLVRCYGLESDGQLTFPASMLAGQGTGAGSLSLFRTHWETSSDDAGVTVALGASLSILVELEYQ